MRSLSYLMLAIKVALETKVTLMLPFLHSIILHERLRIFFPDKVVTFSSIKVFFDKNFRCLE